MGNHEFCTRCHASDFHIGMSCKQAYPEKLAQVDKERKRKEQDRVKALDEAKKIVAGLRSQNIPAELEEEKSEGKTPDVKVVVAGWHLMGNRRKAMSWTNPNRRRSKVYDDW